MATSSGPTQEDLAALDALLNPAPTVTAEKRSAEQKWEPQFRPPTSPTAVPRRPPVRVAPTPAAPSRLPILVTAVAAVVLTTIAAWYFFLRTPKPTIPVAQQRPVPAATARQPLPTAPPTAPAATAPPAVTPTVAPTPIPSAPQSAGPTTSRPPVPTPAPASAPAMAAARPPASATGAAGHPPATGDARALLAQGSLPDAARAFASSLGSGSRERYTAQLLTACSPENVQKAVSAGGAELFILPVAVKGQACYRVCWGLFEGRAAAETALAGLPAYFRQSGVRPRLSSIAELAP